jgi:hypothetical protein
MEDSTPTGSPSRASTPNNPNSEQPKKHRKKAGRDSPFTEGQLARIDSLFPDFEKLLRQHKLHLGKEGKQHDPADVTDWIKKQVRKVMASADFKGKLDLSEKTTKDWETVRCFFE